MQTLLTVEHGYRNDTTFGLRISLNALPTLMCFTFTRCTKYFENLPARIGTFGFAPTRKPTHRQKQKSQFCQRTKDRVQQRK